MTCNGNPIKQNLRNPSKSLLLAIVMKMSGVGPLHISHPDVCNLLDVVACMPMILTHFICLQGGDRVNNWLWSVGDSPLSDTSTAAHFSGIQRDLVHRNAIASAIEVGIFQTQQNQTDHIKYVHFVYRILWIHCRSVLMSWLPFLIPQFCPEVHT